MIADSTASVPLAGFISEETKLPHLSLLHSLLAQQDDPSTNKNGNADQSLLWSTFSSTFGVNSESSSTIGATQQKPKGLCPYAG